jgi:hypothetical protein
VSQKRGRDGGSDGGVHGQGGSWALKTTRKDDVFGSTEVDFDYDESVRAGAIIGRCRMDSWLPTDLRGRMMMTVLCMTLLYIT